MLGWSEGCRTAIHVAARGKQLVNSMILLSAATRIDSRAARVTYGNKLFQKIFLISYFFKTIIVTMIICT